MRFSTTLLMITKEVCHVNAAYTVVLCKSLNNIALPPQVAEMMYDVCVEVLDDDKTDISLDPTLKRFMIQLTNL